MELKEIQGSRAIHPNDNSAGVTVPTTDQTEGQDRTVRRASVPGSPLSRVTSSVEAQPCEDGRGRGHVNPGIGTSENKSESRRKGSVSQLIARNIILTKQNCKTCLFTERQLKDKAK